MSSGTMKKGRDNRQEFKKTKQSRSIEVMTIILVCIFYALHLYFSFKRPLSPSLPIRQNQEFTSAWGAKEQHFDLYKIVLKYANHVKNNDTITTLFSHYPTQRDVYCNGQLEGCVFYAPDNSAAVAYSFVYDIEVIAWWSVIDDPDEWAGLQKKGVTADTNAELYQKFKTLKNF